MRSDLYNNWSWLEPATMRTFQKAIYQLKGAQSFTHFKSVQLKNAKRISMQFITRKNSGKNSLK